MQAFKPGCGWKTILTGILAGGLVWLLSCTYDPFPKPAMPDFYQTFNLPLVEASFRLASLVDSTNHIYGDSLGDSLYFKFYGQLDTVTLTRDIFNIPGLGDIHINQDLSALNEANIRLDTTMHHLVKLSGILREQLGVGVLPLPFPVTVDSVPHTELIDERTDIRIFDPNGIPYFRRVEYLTIKDGTFGTRIENKMLIDIDSVRIRLVNSNGEIIAESFYDHIPPGQTVTDEVPGNLNNRHLRDSVAIVLSGVVPGTNRQPLTIPAWQDPFVKISVHVKIDEIEGVTGIPEPIMVRTGQAIPPSNNTIIRAIIAQTRSSPPDTNMIRFNINSAFGAPFHLEMTFLNFFTATGNLTMATDVYQNQPVVEAVRLDGDTLRHPEADRIVDSLFIDSRIVFIPDNPPDSLTTIPLTSGGSINFLVRVETIALEEIVGFFNERFAIPPLTIQNIPEGFTDIDFGAVFLMLHLYSQIQAATDLNMSIRGTRTGYNPEVVSIIEQIHKASDEEPVTRTDISIDIAPIFNLMPDSIMVSGEAAIPANDTSRLQVGKSFWGAYEIIVPFRIRLKPITIIPVKSTVLQAFDDKTRRQIQSGLIEADILTYVVNDFPLTGTIEVLLANYDCFPLSDTVTQLDSGFQWINDSLFAVTDSGNFRVQIDTLVRMILPAPTRFDLMGRVTQPGQLYQEEILDSTKMNLLMTREKRFIRTRIHIEGTDNYVLVGFSDQIHIVSMLSMTLDTKEMISPSQPDTTPNPSPPPAQKRRR